MTIEYTHLTDVGSSGDPGTPRARPTPWFLGGASVPAAEPADEAGRAAMAAELARLPFLQVVHHLIDFIGEGRRLTKQGELFAVDRRQFESLIPDVFESRAWSPYSGSPLTYLAWNVLISCGWILREEGRVCPAATPLGRERIDSVTEREIDGARCLIVAALDSAVTSVELSRGSEEPDENSLEALLVASGPDGLSLPALPVDGELIHCDETVRFLAQLLSHGHIREVPIDRHTGRVVASELRELDRVSNTMERLVRNGLILIEGHERDEDQDDYGGYDGYWDERVGRPGMTYRAPVVMRGAVAMVRERWAAVAAGEAHAARGYSFMGP